MEQLGQEESLMQRGRTANSPATVYAVIPVYNRIALTRSCIQQLLAQTYGSIQIIVVDGGSTDGTPDIVRREFPEVTIITSSRNLWWAGAMALGIEYALRASMDLRDFILMMNNDTEFDENYVATLVQVSRLRDSAVGALTVDIRDPGRILDAGEFVDWHSYSFPVKTEIQPGEVFFDGVDVLPGRGSLVPISMVRQVGNIAWKRFPHYIADYEFFSRVKRHGFRLGVTYEATLKSDPATTGMAARAGEDRSLWQSARLLFSRRSMNNFLDHYRFIGAAAPRELVGAIRRRYLVQIVYGALERFGVKRSVASGLHFGAKSMWWFVKPPYIVPGSEMKARGIDPGRLMVAGVLGLCACKPGDTPTYYFRAGRSSAYLTGEEVASLYDYVLARGRKLPRMDLVRVVATRFRRVLVPLVWISELDCQKFGVDPAELLASCVIRESGVKGRYVMSSPIGKSTKQVAQAAALYEYAQRERRTLRALRRSHPELR